MGAYEILCREAREKDYGDILGSTICLNCDKPLSDHSSFYNYCHLHIKGDNSKFRVDSPDTQLRMSFLDPEDFSAPGFIVSFDLNRYLDKQSYVKVRINGSDQFWEHTYNITGMLGHSLEHELIQSVIDSLSSLLQMTFMGGNIEYDLVRENLKKIGTIPGVTE